MGPRHEPQLRRPLLWSGPLPVGVSVGCGEGACQALAWQRHWSRGPWGRRWAALVRKGRDSADAEAESTADFLVIWSRPRVQHTGPRPELGWAQGRRPCAGHTGPTVSTAPSGSGALSVHLPSRSKGAAVRRERPFARTDQVLVFVQKVYQGHQGPGPRDQNHEDKGQKEPVWGTRVSSDEV